MKETIGCFFCNGILGLNEDGEIEVIDKYNFEDDTMTDREGNPVEICDDCMIKIASIQICHSDVDPFQLEKYELDAHLIQIIWNN